MRKQIHPARFASLFLGLIAMLALGSGAVFGQAVITIVNGDGPDEGFNDPTPVAPVGGNTGTTLGQQRLIAFQHAAGIWGNKLASNVEIRILARFNPQTCTATSAVLDPPERLLSSEISLASRLFPAPWRRAHGAIRRWLISEPGLN